MYKCRDNSEGVCTCKYPAIGKDGKCLAYIPMESKEAEFLEQIDKMTNDLFNQLGLTPKLMGSVTAMDIADMQPLSVDLVRRPDITTHPDRHTAIGKPDGNCLDCKFQYLEDSEYWCSICPGNPEDI